LEIQFASGSRKKEEFEPNLLESEEPGKDRLALCPDSATIHPNSRRDVRRPA
jgi:hypothetical protein